MKVLLKYLPAFVLLSVLASLPSCTNPTDDGKYVEPISLYEKISGDWTVTGVSMIDETAKAANTEPKEISLIDQFDFSTFGISLDVDGDNEPTTYSVTGTAPELIPAAGYWELSTPFSVTGGISPVIYLYSNASRSTLTGKLTVVAIPGATPTMDLNLTRSSDGIPFVTYVYKLTTATPAAK